MDAFIAELKEHYGVDRVAHRDLNGHRYVKISDTRIPRRHECRTDVLVQLAPGFRKSASRPQIYVRDGTTQPNGKRGRNVNPTRVNGETWLSFSWRISWSAADPAWSLVEAGLMRFAVNDD